MPPKLKLNYRPAASLKPAPGNARRHSARQIAQIADSIRTFGFAAPILVDHHGEVIAGHGRLAAAKLIGMTSVPVVEIGHLTDAQVRALRIADNRLTELSSWDERALKAEFEILSKLELTFDLNITGFDAPEIDLVLSREEGEDGELPPPAPPHPDGAVSQPGDLWSVGGHRVMCADTKDRATIRMLMADARARMVFTDPPYNVRIQGFAGGKGRIKHREFAEASGEMSGEAFRTFLHHAFAAAASTCIDGALAYVFIDWRHVADVVAAGEVEFGPMVNLAVWAKTNPGMGSFYRSAHELIPMFKVGDGKAINNIELGKFGRNRSNVWTYPSVNSFAKHRAKDLNLHPTPKPVALIADAIRDASHRGDIVFDGFAGSGATLVAAERTGRLGYGIEIDPAYCDVIVTRLTQETGVAPRLVETGQAFAEVEAARRNVGTTCHV
jgi:DNA modification methylase